MNSSKKLRPARTVRPPLCEALENRQLLATVTLDFNGGSAGGVANSGFAAVLPTSAGKGLVAGNLSVAGGKLNVVTTSGDFGGTRNTQDNALNIPINGTGDWSAQTRLTSLPFSKNWQNGGLFVGTNQDNFVKLVVGYNGATSLQLGSETNAAFTSAPLRNLSFAGVTTLDLRLVGTASSKTVTAQYRVNSSSDTAWVSIGSVTNANVFSAAARAGIVTTNFGATPITVAYESFSATSADVVTPPPPPPPTGTLSVGANVNATRMADNQVETDIAINPANPNNLAIVGMNQANNSAQLVVSRSFDGGKTWATTTVGSAQDKLSSTTPRVDPHITFDRFGNLYVVYMVAATRTELRMIVARSGNGGASFTATAAVAGEGLGIDFPFIGTGPDATNPAREAVYVGYTNTSMRRVRIVAATSTGLGNLSAFNAPTTVSDDRGTFGSLAVNASGGVVVAWQSAGGGQGANRVMMDVDPDGLGTGATWGADKFVGNTNVGGFDYIPAQPDRSIDANVGVAFDRSNNSSTKGRLYIVYTDEPVNESNDTNVYLRRSDNLGTSWSSPLKVNDDNSGKSQFLPAIAVDQTNGNLAIVWHDARNSPGNNTAQVYGTVSLDHGQSVRPNVRISAGTSNQAGANGSNFNMDFGDYTGVAFHANKFIPVWADNSNSTGNNPNGANSKLDLYTAVVTVTP